MFCWASWTSEEIAQNMFLEEHSGLASPSARCYRWCCVSTILPLAYDKVVCPDVRTTIQKLFHGFAYPAAYSTVLYSRGHGDILHLFPVPSISGPAYWQWKAIQNAYTAHFNLLLVGKSKQAGKSMLDTTLHRCFSMSWCPVECGSNFRDTSTLLCLTVLPDFSPAEQQIKT